MIRNRIIHTCRHAMQIGALLLFALIFSGVSLAQSQGGYMSIDAGSGTLSYYVSASGYGASWNEFSFTPYGGSSTYIDASLNCSGSGYNCSQWFGWNGTSNVSIGTLVLQAGDCTIYFGAEPFNYPYGGAGSECSSSAPPVIYPKYKIASIVYAPPGNNSNDGFMNTLTNGTTTTIVSNFQASVTDTLNVKLDFLGAGVGAGLSVGISGTNGSSNAFTETFSDGLGTGLSSNHSNPNAINHQQDLFILWLNPAVLITSTGSSNAVTYSIGTQSGSNNSPEQVDTVEVIAQAMQGNYQGVTTVPLAALVSQYDTTTDQYDLPGLASVCANPLPQSQCTQANQCGCVPSDFAGIIAQDPLLNYTTTENPLNADISGINGCTYPNGSSQCRFVPVPDAPGSNTQLSVLLSGPGCYACDTPTNPFTVSDSTQNVQTLSGSISESVGYSWKAGFTLFGNGSSFTSSTTFTWTDSESIGQINGNQSQMTGNLSSSTVDCYEKIPVFEDTVFHTFVFQQPAGDSSCP